MDTDSLFLALPEKELSDCIRFEKRLEWKLLRNKALNDSFTADACNFFPAPAVLKAKNMIKENRDCSRKSCYACLARHTAVTSL